ncbi:unnamed protein product [Adineta steineri]|uniref:Uncharacterized protein n=1 Tax=Adineta steineri TaxID=433720 RepID=A0A818R7M0_9BILA|nr:unnamed protein product [Adineta steineri]CAF3650248.1 unnamed protein product [Adineta steineri]
MNILNNFFELSHRYNKKTPDIIPVDCVEQTRTATPIKMLSSTTETKTADSDKKLQALSHQQSNQSSFHCQINSVLSRWQKLQDEKEQYQQQQRIQCPNKRKSSEYDEFDRIMEEDLENQLHELERPEEKYYKQIERTSEEQLKQDNYSEESNDKLERFEKQNDIQSREFEKSKSHQQSYPFKQIQTSSQQQQQILVNKFQLLKVNELIEETEHNLMYLNQWKQKQGTMDKTNLVNKNKMLDRLRRYWTMSKYITDLTKDSINSTCTSNDKDQCGNFDVFDGFIDQLFEGKYDEDDDDDIQIIGVFDGSVMNLKKNPKNIEYHSIIKSEEKESNSDIEEQTPVLSRSTKLTLMKLLRIDFNEIPSYLSKTNQLFDKKIRSILPTTNSLEQLRSIAILMYKIICIDMIRSLWIVYQKSGMGELQTNLQSINQLNRKVSPKEILLLLNENEIVDINQDNACSTLINHCLCQLTDKSEEYRRELRLNTTQISNYTPTMEYIIEKFVEQGLIGLRIEIDCQIILVEHDYIDNILKQQYLAQNPTSTQIESVEHLCKLKSNHERLRCELNLLKDKIPTYLSIHSFDSQSIIESPLINTIRNPSLRQQLYILYKNLMEQIKSKMLNVYLESIEQQMDDYHMKFNKEIDNLWEINKTLAQNQQLTSIMQNLIDQRLANIISRTKCIHKYKTELFDIKPNNH